MKKEIVKSDDSIRFDKLRRGEWVTLVTFHRLCANAQRFAGTTLQIVRPPDAFPSSDIYHGTQSQMERVEKQMSVNKYYSFLKGAVEELFGVSDVHEGTRFIDDLSAKSLNYAQIINELEDEFDVEIAFMEFRRKATVGEAAEYIKGLCEG